MLVIMAKSESYHSSAWNGDLGIHANFRRVEESLETSDGARYDITASVCLCIISERPVVHESELPAKMMYVCPHPAGMHKVSRAEQLFFAQIFVREVLKYAAQLPRDYIKRVQLGRSKASI